MEWSARACMQARRNCVQHTAERSTAQRSGATAMCRVGVHAASSTAPHPLLLLPVGLLLGHLARQQLLLLAQRRQLAGQLVVAPPQLHHLMACACGRVGAHACQAAGCCCTYEHAREHARRCLTRA